jgi:hypothetical protein
LHKDVAEQRIKALNYSTQALEQFEVDVQAIAQDMPQILHAHRAIISLLRESAKFILPNCGDLIDLGEIRQAHIDHARLPFAVVALETPWVFYGASGAEKPQCLRSTKRISLCITMSPELSLRLPDTARFLNQLHGGVVVFSIYWNDASSRWTLPLGGLFIPHRNEVRAYTPKDASHAQRMSSDWLHSTIGRLQRFDVAYTVLMPQQHRESVSQTGVDQLQAHIINETRDEVMTFLKACVVLNCANVGTVQVPAPAVLNQRRKVRGKPPFFTCHVLQIFAPRVSGNSSGTGNHVSPHGHLRRGQIRRVEGEVMWLRPALGNSGSNE